MELLSLVHCSWVAVNEVDDRTGIHHRFSKTSLGVGQVRRSVRRPYPSLRICGKRLDIHASCTVADEKDWCFQESPRGTVGILPLVIVFPEDSRVYGDHICRPYVEALPVCVVREDDNHLGLRRTLDGG